MNTNIFLMSGAGKRFLNAGYEVPKQFLKLSNGKLIIDEIIENSPDADEYIFVINKDLQSNKIFSKWIESLSLNFRLFNVGERTNGQATSLNLVLKEFDFKSRLFVSPCDTVIYDKKIKNIFDSSIDSSLLTVKPSNFHINNFEHFGWVEENNGLINVKCKEQPNDFNNSNVILGFFYFKNKEIFQFGYEKLVKNEEKINEEYYIDLVVNYLVANEYNVHEMVINKFISFGTPEEYEQNKDI